MSEEKETHENGKPALANASRPAPDSSADSADQPGNAADRLARFKALKARQASSKKENLKESQHEAQRMATNPTLLNSLNRKHAVASQKLLQAETEAAGDDFERKRAWDWTAEESEKWDKRQDKKQKHRENNKFQDFGQDARKVYKRQMKHFTADVESYQKDKMAAIEKAAANGGLDIVETEDGELIAVDRDGSFYSTADTEQMQKKPDKAAIDRLVGELEKAEEARLRKQREKLKRQGDDGGDVTYINASNKQFNDKLKRFYDKYTADIRESFERGTAV